MSGNFEKKGNKEKKFPMKRISQKTVKALEGMEEDNNQKNQKYKEDSK